MKWLIAFIAACITLIAIVYIIWGRNAYTPSVETQSDSTVKVSASHTETFSPDEIIVLLRVNLTGPDRNQLLTKLKTSVEGLTEFAESLNIPKDSLVISDFSLDKSWSWFKGKRSFNGFELSQNIKVTLPDPSKVSRFSEGLSTIADVEILSMQPMVRNQEEKENQILKTATQKAKKKAELLAKASGEDLGEVQMISDEPIIENFAPVSFRSAKMFAGAGGYMDIEQRAAPLQQKITLGSTVFIVFNLE